MIERIRQIKIKLNNSKFYSVKTLNTPSYFWSGMEISDSRKKGTVRVIAKTNSYMLSAMEP